MATPKQLITRSLIVATLLCLAPATFGGSAVDGVGKELVGVSEACAEADECCPELFSYCGERPNMTACIR